MREGLGEGKVQSPEQEARVAEGKRAGRTEGKAAWRGNRQQALPRSRPLRATARQQSVTPLPQRGLEGVSLRRQCHYGPARGGEYSLNCAVFAKWKSSPLLIDVAVQTAAPLVVTLYSTRN